MKRLLRVPLRYSAIKSFVLPAGRAPDNDMQQGGKFEPKQQEAPGEISIGAGGPCTSMGNQRAHGD